MKKWHIIIITLLTLPLQVLANTYIVNPEHSKIKFTISYMKFTEVEGIFPKFDINFEMDDSLTISKLEGRINVADINTNDKKRDSHLKKSDFFDVDKYPTIDLKLNSKSAKLQLKKSQKILIDTTIKGITKSIDFTLLYLGEKPDPWTKVSGHYFNLEGQINRLDFDITWNKALENEEGFLVGEVVTLRADIESYKSNERPAFSRFFKEKIVATPTSNIQISPEATKPVEQTKRVDIVKEEAPPKIEYSSFKNVVVTLISGSIIFISLITFGILGQKKLSEYLEKKNFSDSVNYIISSGVIMIVLIIISIFVAPYMGHGINPLTKLFN